MRLIVTHSFEVNMTSHIFRLYDVQRDISPYDWKSSQARAYPDAVFDLSTPATVPAQVPGKGGPGLAKSHRRLWHWFMFKVPSLQRGSVIVYCTTGLTAYKPRSFWTTSKRSGVLWYQGLASELALFRSFPNIYSLPRCVIALCNTFGIFFFLMLSFAIWRLYIRNEPCCNAFTIT